jgi:hypothetical protein
MKAMYCLAEFPLIMEGFHCVQSDKGRVPGSPTWYVARHSTIPDEWVAEFIAVERAMGMATGLLLGELFPQEVDRPEWFTLDNDAKDTDLVLRFVYWGVNDSVLDIFTALTGSAERARQVEALFNDFFDGGEDSRHQRMQELFITTEYMY